ncbi:XdhC family protein [Breoghania sp. L-A4]|uniref:XdhC family protein n=1 Tax=Breoghania sp. L-A4 TaxID=2304600 RepID=UPI000E35FDB3|nr:XdhC family protein [Breoghania sp. L-A4]AXS39056.1 XdhC family protein [Breoghania sp. L-A4]
MQLALLEQLNAERAARRGCILITDVTTGAQRLVREADPWADDPLHEELDRRFRSGKSGMIEDAADNRLFLGVEVPPPRILVIGAVHISQALAPIAAIAGFDVTIIDPRTAFATPERFPGTPLFAQWPDEVLGAEVTLDRYTALVAVTHDPKIDDFPLKSALEADCFYVGALGSRKTHATRVERLKDGLSSEQIDRIHAPIGLDIGAASPAEIAVAVMAQIIEDLRKSGRASAGVAREAAA